MEVNIKTKTRLLDYCLTYVEERISRASEAMRAAQISANTESKSSAGDKYETGRAMMQIERDKNAILLSEAQKLKQALSQINPSVKHEKVRLGSLVSTDNGFYYFSISVGKITLDNQTLICLSPASPLGKAFLDKSASEVINFNSQLFKILKLI